MAKKIKKASSKKKALITGITGQDGSYLAELLLSKGYEVAGIVRKTSHMYYANISHIQEDLNLIQADLLDPVSLREAIQNVRPDEIYNLASQSHPSESFKQPIHTAEITGIGAHRVIDAALDIVPKSKVYQASSSEMYGWVKEIPQSEDTSFNPANPYAAAKLYAHNIAKIYRKSYGQFITCGILFNHECVSENTPVIVRNKLSKVISIKQLKEIKKPRLKGRVIQQWEVEDLEIWDGKEFVDLNIMTATKKRSKNDDYTCRIINTRHGVVNVTNHHNMLTRDNKKVRARRVRKGAKLLHGKLPKSLEISLLSEQEAEFLGMMVGDGYVSETGRGAFSNNKKEIRRRLAKLWFQIALGGTSFQRYKTEYGYTERLVLNGNVKYLRLLRSEIYSGRYKKVPDRVLNSTIKVQLAFLRGYNCTDGLSSNLCTYEFKCFKTNSGLLAQGLLFLISQTTKVSQDGQVLLKLPLISIRVICLYNLLRTSSAW